MTAEAASALGIETIVLAERPDAAAAGVASDLLIGSPGVADDLAALAGRCDVVTFDHELVDLRLLGALESAGTEVRPGTGTLELAVDKSTMRRTLGAAGLPMPAYAVIDETTADPLGAIADFASTHGWPVVLKAARGGYDGKGVWPVADLRAAEAVLAGPADGTLLIEEHVAIEAEIAVLVARRPGGETVTWPAVETAQVGGVCREVLVPGRLGPDVLHAAGALGVAVSEVAGSVGVLAVELFFTGGRLVINEIAARPHNSGHWTIEGSVTSQFENHLRAVLDLPLGATDPTAPHVASVNVFGAQDGHGVTRLLAGAMAVEGAHVHLYGKEGRPGRKLGHVTVCGADPDDVRARAWAAARSLGTPVPEGIELAGGGA